MLPFDLSSLFRNFIHVGAGTPMLLWIAGMFGVTDVQVNGVIGAISTLVTIGATVWSQWHAKKKA